MRGGPRPRREIRAKGDGAIGAGAFRGIAANRGYKAVLPLIAPRVPRYLLGSIGKNAAEIEAAAQGYGGLFLPTDAKKRPTRDNSPQASFSVAVSCRRRTTIV